MPSFGHVLALFLFKTRSMATLRTVSRNQLALRFRNSIPLRVGALAASSGLAGGLFYLHTGPQIAGQPVWLVAGLLYAAAIGLTAAFIYRFLPKLGPFMELTSISRLLLAGASALVPAVAVVVTTSPVLNATLIVLGAALIRVAGRARERAQAGPGFPSRSSRPAQVPGEA